MDARPPALRMAPRETCARAQPPLFRLVGACLIATGLAACESESGESSPAVHFAVRDSAGVRIAENSESAIASRARRRLGEPELSLGGAGAPEPYEFYHIQGVVGLSDGGLAVLNRGTHEVRVFDGSGRFLRALGRWGRGPGEFDFPTLLQPLGGGAFLAR